MQNHKYDEAQCYLYVSLLYSATYATYVEKGKI